MFNIKKEQIKYLKEVVVCLKIDRNNYCTLYHEIEDKIGEAENIAKMAISKLKDCKLEYKQLEEKHAQLVASVLAADKETLNA